MKKLLFIVFLCSGCGSNIYYVHPDCGVQGGTQGAVENIKIVYGYMDCRIVDSLDNGLFKIKCRR